MNENKYKDLISHLLPSTVLKWYRKKWKIVKIIQGRNISISQNEKNISHYYVKKENMDYIYSLNPANSVDEIKEWADIFSDGTQKEPKAVNVKYTESKNSFDVENLIMYLQKISTENMEYAFKVFYEHYIENLFLKSGIAEEREIQYAVVDIEHGDNKIGSLLYNKNLSFEQLKQDVMLKIQNNKTWLEFPEGSISELEDGRNILCITSPEVAAMLFHESIAHLAEADIYTSLEKSDDIKTGTKICFDELSVTDYPNRSEIQTNIYFDEEGTEAKSVNIVDQGFLKSLLSDQRTKNEDVYKVYGFLRSSMDNAEPQIRMRNIVIENGTKDLNVVLEGIKRGIFIEEADDSYRDKTVIFLHIKKAYLVIDGKKTKKIQNIWLKNQNKEFLSGIFAIGMNGMWSELKTCNKNEGTIYISSFAPGIGCFMNLPKTF